mgnify:CR=1 FL=1
MSCYPLQVVSRMVMNRSGEVFYIGGNDVLPAPLEPKREAFILQKLGTGQEEEAKSVLIEHNLRLVVYIAKKFDNTGVGVEDLISIGTIGLIKAVDSFDESKKIRLASYASRCIENELLMNFRARKKTARDVYLYDSIGSDKEGNEISLIDIIEYEDEDISERITREQYMQKLKGFMNEVLTEREKEILTLRYGLDGQGERTQKEVARLYGISRSYVSRIEKKALMKLNKCYQSIL